MNFLHSLARRAAACVFLTSTLVHAAGNPAPLAGTWHATLQTSSAGLALELTVRQDPGGAFSASLESVDQAPGQPIAVEHVTLDQEKLTLSLAAIGAGYEGRYQAATGAWQGEWRQGRTLPLTWLPGPVPAAPAIAGIDGDWRATLERNGSKLRLVLHVSTGSRGTRARLDSPDIGVTGMDVGELRRDGARVRFRVPLAEVVFVGSLDDAGASLEGRWRRQGLPEARVRFVRDGAGAAAVKPSQAAAPAPPYTASEVRFANADAGIMLAGTLTMPAGAGPHPAAILISGTGPHDRDATTLGHKPFAVLADSLSRRGIAVLRVDERGVGASGGSFDGATNADFTSDVQAAVRFLAQQDGIASKAIGLIGHSQGGAVGPLAAQGNPQVAFLVLLAAPGTPIPELLLAQRRMTGVTQGQSGPTLARNEAALTALFAAAALAPDRPAARASLTALLTPARLKALGITALQGPALVDELSADWLRDLLRYDARRTLAGVTAPILALNGSLDRQVPAAANLAAIRRASAGNRDVTVAELPSLNHLFQHAKTGLMSEYGEIGESFAASAMELIGDWITAHVPHG